MFLNFRKLSATIVITTLTICLTAAIPAKAEVSEVKEKPRLYSYVAIWTIPRADWAAMNEPSPAARDLVAKSLASGKLVGVGEASSLMHHHGGPTHMNWWSSMSEAGLLAYLDDESALPGNPVLTKSTNHADFIVVSTYYNRKAATIKSGYEMVSYLKLKADAPEKTYSLIAKTVVAPVLEKLFTEGALAEYSICAEDFQSGPARGFWVEWIAPNADAVDKVNAAWRDALEKSATLDFSMGYIDWDAARDYIYHVDATLK